ncbi:hypothetical protein DLM75_02005 [Leptospira stimsonii]|uniref:Uncharacterized protein n=1 Tax=Leptospira stimsonii TaxID=2202203 RepID=A0A396ZBX5_9LEPT|nr:hypothetical protein DLM75_02005 [Leptospira stimsonii]
MKNEICNRCRKNESLSQTDLCKDCLREKFKKLIPSIDRIRPIHPNFSRFSSTEDPKGVA